MPRKHQPGARVQAGSGTVPPINVALSKCLCQVRSNVVGMLRLLFYAVSPSLSFQRPQGTAPGGQCPSVAQGCLISQVAGLSLPDQEGHGSLGWWPTYRCSHLPFMGPELSCSFLELLRGGVALPGMPSCTVIDASVPSVLLNLQLAPQPCTPS